MTDTAQTKKTRMLTKQLIVRVDADTRRRLEADAEANGRTLAQSVRFLLRQSLIRGSTEDR